MKSLNILLVNEAGCFSPGIIALGKALSRHHRVVIVAPLHPQLSTGHRLTTSLSPLRVEQYFVLNKIKIFSVNGTPCDCVTLALDKILLSKPDLIISGISHHNNVGELIYKSGVVSAAIEGTIQGIPSIAISACVRKHGEEKDFLPIANSFARHLPYFVKNMPDNATLNLNYPEKFKAAKIVCTHLTTDMVKNKYKFEANPYGNTFYWLLGHHLGYPMSVLSQEGDVYYLEKGFITVTPLKLDLTEKNAIEVVEKSGLVCK
ncbi:MAG: 5'/3'-nucleotidase SurE [Firmicutes bacterium]|nr:5'/3'-nucleotidase SurE [Bacillota bacterium]